MQKQKRHVIESLCSGMSLKSISKQKGMSAYKVHMAMEEDADSARA